MAPAVMATIIIFNDWVTFIAYNNLDNAGIMTYAVSDSKGGSILGTYDTFCIKDNVNIWTGESFLVQDISGIVDKFESSKPGIGPFEMCWKIRSIMLIISERGNMKKNLLVAVLMVMSIPSLALASVATRVSEPASMLLFGAGLIGVGIMRKKFKG